MRAPQATPVEPPAEDTPPGEPLERFFDARPAGMLVGRPDLTEADLLAAIAERLVFEGRTGPEPAVVIEAARLGKRKALAFLRKLLLPPPRSPLVMPVRPILAEHAAQATGEAH